MKRLQSGEAKAFAEMVLAYQNLVFNTVNGFLGSQSDSEDVAQEVFLQVHLSIKQFKGECKLTTWLYRISVTKSMDWLKRKNRKKRFAFLESLSGRDDGEKQLDVAGFDHPGVATERKEQAAILFRALQDLPENQKIAFTLNKVEGLSYQEVADVMAVSVASVEAYLHRAKQNLRKNLGEMMRHG